MKRILSMIVFCVACSSNGTTSDGGADVTSSDGANACSAITTDASFTCDVSAVPPADQGCATWVSDPPDSGIVSCPGAAGWSGGVGGGCQYTWTKSGPPNLCELPSAEDGRSAFAWLHPTCNNGCDASIDVAPPAPCATSATCPSTQYCEYNGNCGGNGTCFLIDNGGVGVPSQVCGCDNKTYTSADAAHQARISVAYSGACE